MIGRRGAWVPGRVSGGRAGRGGGACRAGGRTGGGGGWVPGGVAGGGGGGVRGPCRGGVAAGAVTATLICACRDRRSAAGRMVPLTNAGNHRGAHRTHGDRSCRGE